VTAALLPPEFPEGRLAARAGLIADTHLPDRLRALPAALATIFEGCDLLLHAGDVGQLRVLDELSRIAPVVAVHGNDDTAEAQRELPEQQLLTVAGCRILLWHSHDPDWAGERRLREANAWPPVLARIRERARRAGATVAIFGHAHVPLQVEEDGMLLANPGALASGNPFIRQRLQSVALLFVRDDGAVAVRHVDLSAPEQAYTPHVDRRANFTAAHDAVSAPVLAPELGRLPALLQRDAFNDLAALKQAYLDLAHECWEGGRDQITASVLWAALDGNPAIDPADRQLVWRLLAEGGAI
jgi:uncharacterized protein